MIEKSRMHLERKICLQTADFEQTVHTKRALKFDV